MKNAFRIISLLLVFVLLFGLAGCGRPAGLGDTDKPTDEAGIPLPSGQPNAAEVTVPPSAGNETENDNVPLSSEEVSMLTDIWTNALKNRDGKARYEIISESMRKGRDDGPIGDLNFLVCKSNGLAYPDCSDIVYYLIDAFGHKYISEEHLTFAREKGRPVVIGCDTGEAVWEREYRFMPTAEAAFFAMVNAVVYDDYYGMLSLAHKERDSKTPKEYLLKAAWGGMELSERDIRESKAMFRFSYKRPSGETKNKDLWFLFEKDDRGWYCEYMFYNVPPDQAWWQAPISRPVVIQHPYHSGKIVTDEEFVLPNGVALEMTYDEVASQLGGYENGFQHSPGTRIIEDRGIHYAFYLVNGQYTLSRIDINNANILYKPSEAGTIRDIKMGDSVIDVLSKIPAQNKKLQKWATQKLYGSDRAGTKNSAVLQYNGTYTIFITSENYMMLLNFDQDDTLWALSITLKE